MDQFSTIFSHGSYLGLLFFLLAFFAVFRSVEVTAHWFWEKYGDRISDAIRQSRL